MPFHPRPAPVNKVSVINKILKQDSSQILPSKSNGKFTQKPQIPEFCTVSSPSYEGDLTILMGGQYPAMSY